MPTTICAGKLWIFFCIFCIAIIIFFGGVYVVDKINLQLMKLQIYETQLEQCSHGKHTRKIFLLHLHLKLNINCVILELQICQREVQAELHETQM